MVLLGWRPLPRPGRISARLIIVDLAELPTLIDQLALNVQQGICLCATSGFGPSLALSFHRTYHVSRRPSASSEKEYYIAAPTVNEFVRGLRCQLTAEQAEAACW